MSTNSSLNFICPILSSGNDAYKSATGTSKLCTNLPSCVSKINGANSASSAMDGIVASSLWKKVHWGPLSAHVLPLILLNTFYLMRTMAWSNQFCFYPDMIAGYCGPKTVRLCKCFYSFNIATTDIFPYVFMPFPSPYEWKMCGLLSYSIHHPISIPLVLLFVKLHTSISVIWFTSYIWF